jgi:hypothetical protein
LKVKPVDPGEMDFHDNAPRFVKVDVVEKLLGGTIAPDSNT